MANCYRCDAALTALNLSIEHIIPNAIGGIWKSKELLCNRCNRELGNSVDTALCQSFHSIAALLNIDRERGEHAPIRNLRSESGDVYHLIEGRYPVRANPDIKLDAEKNSVRITARDEKALRLLLKQLKKRYPLLDDSKLTEKATKTRYYMNEALHVDMEFGGANFFRGVAKVAVGAWLEQFKDKFGVLPAIKLLSDNSQDPGSWVKHYYSPELMAPQDSKAVAHTILIKSNSDLSLLYAYVEFFSSCAFIVELNKEYKGEPVQFLYSYDVLSKTRSDFVPTLDYKGGAAPGLDEVSIGMLEKKLARVLHIADQRQQDWHIDSLVMQAMDKMQSLYPDATHFTEDMLQAFLSDLAQSYAQFICHLYKKRERLNKGK